VNFGRIEGAEMTLRSGLMIFLSEDIFFNLIKILYEQERYEETERYLDTALEIDPENYVYYDDRPPSIWPHSYNSR